MIPYQTIQCLIYMGTPKSKLQEVLDLGRLWSKEE